MPTKRQPEGFLLIDDRASGGRLLERSTVTCSHCQRLVVMNPLRTRDRAYCRKCDKYICDQCEAYRVANGYECRTMDQVFDELAERITKHGPMVCS